MIDPLTFLGIAMLVVAAPGPAVAHVVGCALVGGLRMAAAAITGLVLGQAALVTTSLSAGIALHPQAGQFMAAQAVAGVVLLLIGLRTMIRAADPAAPPRIAGGRLGAGLAGFGIVVVNPVSLPFIAAMGLAAADGTAPSWPQIALLAAAYAGTGLVIYGGYALAAARLASASRAPRWRVALRALAGAAIAAAGLTCLLRVAIA